MNFRDPGYLQCRAKESKPKAKQKAKPKSNKATAKLQQSKGKAKAKAKHNTDLSQKLFTQIQQGYKVQLKGTFE